MASVYVEVSENRLIDNVLGKRITSLSHAEKVLDAAFELENWNDRGCDKTQLTITFTDGHQYTMRLDFNAAEPSIAKALQNRIEWAKRGDIPALWQGMADYWLTFGDHYVIAQAA